MLVLTTSSLGAAPFLLAFGAIGLWVAHAARRSELRPRCFAVNFATHALTVETPGLSHRSGARRAISFASIGGFELCRQGDGRYCLTVDLLDGAARGRALRKVLVAHVAPSSFEELQRLARLLRAAVGLVAEGETATMNERSTDQAPLVEDVYIDAGAGPHSTAR